jgi:hypothetical protein
LEAKHRKPSANEASKLSAQNPYVLEAFKKQLQQKHREGAALTVQLEGLLSMKQEQLAHRKECRAELIHSASQESQVLSGTRAAAVRAADQAQQELSECDGAGPPGEPTPAPGTEHSLAAMKRITRRKGGPTVLLHRTPQPISAVRTLL